MSANPQMALLEIITMDLGERTSTSQGRLEAARKSIELSKGKIDAVIACAGLTHATLFRFSRSDVCR